MVKVPGATTHAGCVILRCSQQPGKRGHWSLDLIVYSIFKSRHFGFVLFAISFWGFDFGLNNMDCEPCRMGISGNYILARSCTLRDLIQFWCNTSSTWVGLRALQNDIKAQEARAILPIWSNEAQRKALLSRSAPRTLTMPSRQIFQA